MGIRDAAGGRFGPRRGRAAEADVEFAHAE